NRRILRLRRNGSQAAAHMPAAFLCLIRSYRAVKSIVLTTRRLSGRNGHACLPGGRSTPGNIRQQETAMDHMKRSPAVWAIGAMVAVIAAAGPARAQTLTTGTISGVVMDQQEGVLPGVAIDATHTPTGTKYDAVTEADGRFQIPNVRVGPYVVTATLSGFKTRMLNDVIVQLGQDQSVEFKLPIESLSETVTV